MKLTQKLQEAYAEAGVTPEQITALEAIFTDEEILKKLEAQHMKNADYTIKTSEVAAERKRLADEKKRMEDEYESTLGTVNQYKTDLEARLNAALKQAADSDLRGAALNSKLRSLAAQYGEDPDELLKDVKEIREEPKKEIPAFDDAEFNKRYVSRDEYQGAYGSVLSLAPMIRDLERDYQKTFGKEFEGSITELIRENAAEVQKLQQRGQKDIDLFGHIRAKLGFSEQAKVNEAAAKTKAEEDKKKWEADTRAEIERNVRSEVMAGNPRAYTPEPTEAWRQKLSASSRQVKNQVPVPNPIEQVKHRQNVYADYEKRAAERQSGAT